MVDGQYKGVKWLGLVVGVLYFLCKTGQLGKDNKNN